MINRIDLEYCVKDISLYKKGEYLVKAAFSEMVAFSNLREKFKDQLPLRGERISVCAPITPETANFLLLLKALGAEVRCCSDGIRSCIDSVAAFLATEDISIYAKSIEEQEEHKEFLTLALQFKDQNSRILGPTLIVDDGSDITYFAIENYPELLKDTKGACEQTNSGISKCYKLHDSNQLALPVISIAQSISKSKFDNLYGTREATIGSIYNIMNIQISGKHVLVIGYGNVGKGVACAFRSFGAHVYIAEADPINLAMAYMDGFFLTTVERCVSCTDIFVTATGNINVITKEHFYKMKKGAIVCNVGHEDVEINVREIDQDPSIKKEEINEHMTKLSFPDGRDIFLLCKGHLTNIVAGTGNPPSVMAVTFTNHLLGLFELINSPQNYSEKKVYPFPKRLDEVSILLNFPEVRENLTTLTEQQTEYLGIEKGAYIKRHRYYYTY